MSLATLVVGKRALRAGALLNSICRPAVLIETSSLPPVKIQAFRLFSHTLRCKMPGKMPETPRVTVGNLRIDERIYKLVNEEIAPGTGIDGKTFWSELGMNTLPCCIFYTER
jgi:hypothetical protein